MQKRFSRWTRLLIVAACFWAVLMLLDVLIGYLFGPQIWFYAGYFFGNSLRIAVGVIMCIEGAILIALGSVWVSGAMEIVFQGGNLKTNPYYRKDDWKQRKEETEKQKCCRQNSIAN